MWRGVGANSNAIAILKDRLSTNLGVRRVDPGVSSFELGPFGGVRRVDPGDELGPFGGVRRVDPGVSSFELGQFGGVRRVESGVSSFELGQFGIKFDGMLKLEIGQFDHRGVRRVDPGLSSFELGQFGIHRVKHGLPASSSFEIGQFGGMLTLCQSK
ncbi:unnamed protein product [Sphagnum jensenii]|uniref:Uncharacterized protein n=1 Tax=Sphagnum jensenii TaxID=128206 RepID=A0ABP0X5A6_9BRYO